MPFTPFHFGPGLFGKSLLSRYFSWSAFIASQVVIDFETLYYMIQRAYPIHRFFHTILGATLAGIVVGVGLVGLKSIIKTMAPQSTDFIASLRPSLKAEVSSIGLLVGALIGGISHPFLDGMMHRDVRPFSPWSDANPLLRVIGVEALHLLCLLLGIIGLIFMAMRLYREGLANKSVQPTRACGPRG